MDTTNKEMLQRIERLELDVAWIKQFIAGLPMDVEEVTLLTKQSDRRLQSLIPQMMTCVCWKQSILIPGLLQYSFQTIRFLIHMESRHASCAVLRVNAYLAVQQGQASRGL